MEKGSPRKPISERKTPDLFQVRLGKDYIELLYKLAAQQYRNPTDLLRLWIDDAAEVEGLPTIQPRPPLQAECHQ